MREYELLKNEEAFGQEARERFGDEAVDASNARLAALTSEEWDEKMSLEDSIKEQLRAAMAEGDPSSPAASELAQMHEQWIRIHWGDGYNREAHLALARGYLDDPRFIDYYDSACGEGATAFLVSVLEANL